MVSITRQDSKYSQYFQFQLKTGPSRCAGHELKAYSLLAPNVPLGQRFAAESKDEAMAILDEARQLARAAGVARVQAKLVHGEVKDAIVKATAEFGVSLIVLSSPARGPFKVCFDASAGTWFVAPCVCAGHVCLAIRKPLVIVIFLVIIIFLNRWLSCKIAVELW